jgi:hypothetical protein
MKMKAGDLAKKAEWEAHRRSQPESEPESDWFEPAAAAGPGASIRQLPPAEFRPPDFLTPMEAMRDVYMRIRHRASVKTQELLEGPDLDDLLSFLRVLFESDLDRDPRARLPASLRKTASHEDSPLLVGLDDVRLVEPWRLFQLGWDIWTPADRSGGVELFWEGEVEDEAEDVQIVLQSLTFREGELTLQTRLGASEDTVTFDGEHFYRRLTPKPTPSD